MPNIRLTVAYDGTNYAGWQIQKNANTIQAELEKALKKILKENIRVTGAGRTDSGVHAVAQIANFSIRHCERPKGAKQSHRRLLRLRFAQPRNDGKKTLHGLQAALNAKLPADIRITAVKHVPEKFHSRFDAKTKIYRYTILAGCIDDPFTRKYYSKVPYKLDVRLMKKEARALVGKHDFRAFQSKAAYSAVKSTVRSVKNISVRKKSQFVYINIEADGFLYNMVRNIVGTLIEIGRGYMLEGSMKKILDSRDRRKAGPTAPAKGLTLVKVLY